MLKDRFVTIVFVLKVTLNTTQDNDFVVLVSACTCTLKDTLPQVTGFVIVQPTVCEDETVSEMRSKPSSDSNKLCCYNASA